MKNTNHVEIDELFEMLGKDLKHENARHHPPRSAKVDFKSLDFAIFCNISQFFEISVALKPTEIAID